MTEMTQIRLIDPTEDLREGYLNYIEEFREAGEVESPGSGWHAGDSFDSLIRRLRDHARGRNLPEGWVPDSTYWLLRGNRLIGACDIRHRLTEALMDFGGHIGYAIRPGERSRGYGTIMLRLALEKARALGINRVLITCDRENAASVRVIQKNAGVLDSESYSKRAGRVTQRYWIELAQPPHHAERRRR